MSDQITRCPGNGCELIWSVGRSILPQGTSRPTESCGGVRYILTYMMVPQNNNIAGARKLKCVLYCFIVRMSSRACDVMLLFCGIFHVFVRPSCRSIYRVYITKQAKEFLCALWYCIWLRNKRRLSWLILWLSCTWRTWSISSIRSPRKPSKSTKSAIVWQRTSKVSFFRTPMEIFIAKHFRLIRTPCLGTQWSQDLALLGETSR